MSERIIKSNAVQYSTQVNDQAAIPVSSIVYMAGDKSAWAGPILMLKIGDADWYGELEQMCELFDRIRAEFGEAEGKALQMATTQELARTEPC